VPPSSGQGEVMRITYLLEVANQTWGGVKVALEDANWLSQRGHQVTVVSRSGPPTWMKLGCAFQQVENFRPEHLPDADVVIGTLWSTVPWAASAGPKKGVPVHLCQGYEGDNPVNEAVRDRIEAAYRLPGMHHVTVSPHLTALMRDRFGIRAHEIIHAIDHEVHKPGPKRAPQSPLRIGLVGPYAVPSKDLPTGYKACQLADKAGQNLILVRASNTPPSPEEQNLPFPVEWHQELRPDQMGDFYRSLDVFLGTSSGGEGFFLPAIEAMACGVPSVLTDIPCFRNHSKLVGHDRYAMFVKAQDPTAMAEAIVLAGALPDIRTTLRACGIEVASKYHQDHHGEQLEQVLESLVATPAQGTRPAQGSQQQGELRLLTKEIPTPPLPVSLPMLERPSPSSDTASNPKIPIQQVPPGSNIADNISSLADKVFGKKHGEDNPLPRLLGELHDAAHQEKIKGNFRNVARLLEAARCLNNDDKAEALSKATSRLASGNAEQALRLYDERLEAGDDDEELHTGRGNALHALDRVHEAAQAFRAALAVGTRTPDNYNRLGVVLYQAGDLTAARYSFERALMLDSKHVDARANLSALPAA
jgi:glycosyltransferase involved in cell wall biosynthesis